MTLESYNKAKDIVTKIHHIDTVIDELKNIMKNDTSKWLLEVRANRSWPLYSIDHYGTLPEVLKVILSKHIAERNALVDELSKL